MNSYNPFIRPGRYRYAWALIPNNLDSILDFGCNDGFFTYGLKDKAKEIFGIDRDRELIQKAVKAYSRCGNIKFFKLDDAKLPFPDHTFDAVTMLEVIEHIPKEKETLHEIYRVMKPFGILVLSCPHKGLFSFLDPGNIKIYFPKIHKLLYVYVLKQKKDYFKKFVNNIDNLVGDVSISDDMFHKHYNLYELQGLLSPLFHITYVKRFGLLENQIGLLNYLSNAVFKKKFTVIEKLIDINLSKNYGEASYNILVKASRSSNDLM